jgi:hypothetical protein
MKRTLHLTTPLMHGPDVLLIQKLLHDAGALGGTIDGAYGQLTAQAVFRYKYRIGYPSPDHIAGNKLLAYLEGKSKPSLIMRALAAKRAGAAKRKQKPARAQGLTHGQLIVKHALSQLGQTEHPYGSNKSKFSNWYGIVGAWCAMFVTWNFVTLGFSKKTFRRSLRYAYVPYMVADATLGRNGLMKAHDAGDGIVVTYDWNKDGVADHTGIAATPATLRLLAPGPFGEAEKRFGTAGPDEFWAVEGNTGIGNDSNGGEVMIRKRSRHDVQAFIRVAA